MFSLNQFIKKILSYIMNINNQTNPNIKNLIISNSLIIFLSLVIVIMWKNKIIVNSCLLLMFLVFIISVSITLSYKKHKSV